MNAAHFFIIDFDGFNVMCFVDNDTGRPRERPYLEFDTLEEADEVCTMLNMWCEGRLTWN